MQCDHWSVQRHRGKDSTQPDSGQRNTLQHGRQTIRHSTMLHRKVSLWVETWSISRGLKVDAFFKSGDQTIPYTSYSVGMWLYPTSSDSASRDGFSATMPTQIQLWDPEWCPKHSVQTKSSQYVGLCIAWQQQIVCVSISLQLLPVVEEEDASMAYGDPFLGAMCVYKHNFRFLCVSHTRMQCSEECGYGLRSREVLCYSPVTLTQVPREFCDSSTMPVTKSRCFLRNCGKDLCQHLKRIMT